MKGSYILLVCFVVWLVPAFALAQPLQSGMPTGTAGSPEAPIEGGQPPAPIVATVAEGAAAGKLPRPPEPFYRGNRTRKLDGTPDRITTGFYLPPVAFGLFVALFFLWTRTTWWADEDSKGLNLNGDYWNAYNLCIGAVGFLVALNVPNFYLAFLTVVCATGVPLGLYIRERNGHVPEAAKVMTPAHIKKVLIRTLARMGINIATTREAREAAIGPPIRFLGKSDGKGADAENLVRQAEKSKQFMSAKELVYDAILRRATDIHIEPKSDEVAARYRIDGVMFPAEPFDLVVGAQIVNIFKILSAMDITEKRKPQDGSFRAELENRMIDFRVATAGTRDGEKMSMRILDQSNSVSQLSGLGMRKQMQDQLKEVIHSPHGMLIACGPTGAGKSTTLYTLLNEIDSSQLNIITVEDPVEYKMANVNQIEINTKAGQTFGGSLRSILRQDPDVVMVGEIRDDETAKTACQAANTGHMVFSTVHANDTISALYRLMDLGVEPFMLSSALSAIIGQRLCRKLCEDCKVPYKPKPELLKSLALPPDKVDTFYKPPEKSANPCPTCGGIGYKGRMGVYELFIINDRIKDMIRENAQVTAVRGEARKNGMMYIKEEGLRLVVKGLTSYEELIANVK